MAAAQDTANADNGALLRAFEAFLVVETPQTAEIADRHGGLWVG
jgi:hypothetical protein